MVTERTMLCGGRGQVAITARLAEKHLYARPGALRLFRRERFALSMCCHPALPRLVGWDDATLTLRMNALRGVNLDRYVRDNGPLPPEMVWQLLTAIASALLHLHAKGLYHLDVKPRNIVFCPRENGTASVGMVDLGSVGGPALPFPRMEASEPLRRLGTGQFLHCCPEQLLQRVETLGGHWDAFGLGASAYYARFGAWPAGNDTRRAQTMLRQYRLLGGFPAPEAGDRAIRTLLAPSPERAYACLNRLVSEYRGVCALRAPATEMDSVPGRG